MKIQNIFYIVGVVFIFAAAAYFGIEFIYLLSTPSKVILLWFSVAITFIIADYLRRQDK